MRKKAHAFDEMPTSALMCRSLGHAWTIELVTPRRRGNTRVWEVALSCMRCKTTRDDVVPVNSSMDSPFTLARGYGYSDLYMVEDLEGWGGAALLKRNARKELLGRLQEVNGKGVKKR